MTLNRYLLLFTLLIGSILTFLSFAPPQTGKWVYMWQAYVIEANDGYSLKVPAEFSGNWYDWDSKGKGQTIYICKSKTKPLMVYSRGGVPFVPTIDRRAEFGIVASEIHCFTDDIYSF